MATLWVKEYDRIPHDGAGLAVLAGLEPSGREQTVAIGGASTQSTQFSGRFVRLHTDVVCHVAFGLSPTATTANMRLAANQTEFFGIVSNATVFLAVIAGV